MLCNKISKSLYIINRVKNFLPRKSLCTLYYSLVHTHLNYCASIFGCATKTKLKPLFLKQKQAIRVITNSQYRAHTNPLFKELNIMPLNELIVFSQLKFMYKFKNNMLPLSFAETWITNRERNPNLNLRNADNIYIPPHRLETLKRLPIFEFAKLWNEDQTDQNQPFKMYLKHLKSRLLENIN